ncbi:MAG TPA: NifU family protein [Thermoleophilaceae bacterium]
MLTVTDHAVQKVKEFRERVEDGGDQAMWIAVTGVHRGEFTYDLALRPLSAAGPDDAVEHFDGLPVVVPAGDAEALRDATIDWSDDLMQGGLTVSNPNRPAVVSPDVAAGGGELTGDVSERVAQVIDRQINPAIAQHGGMARLERVADGVAYVRLGGGCQGCGMATVTLDQGIESAILQAVPEIRQVVDVTDHAAGENPYFQPA